VRESELVIDRVEGVGNPPENALEFALEFLLALPAVRHIASYLQIAPMGAGIVPNRRDRHVRPEPRPVLSDAPPFVLGGAGLERSLEVLFGNVRRSIRIGVKRREVLADDLLAVVALEGPRTPVPGEDVTVRVQSEDRVLLDGVDQGLKRFPVLFCRSSSDCF